MSIIPACPNCKSSYVYEDQTLYICPECAHEWLITSSGEAGASDADDAVVKDAYGTVLQDGDSVSLIKDLKVKGAGGTTLKQGTKVKNIMLCDGDHNIDCKIPEIGAMKLKSEFVKKL